MMTKRGRIHNKVAIVMKSGEPVLIEQFAQVFKDTKIEPVLYRLSTNIWNIKNEGGIIKSIKQKRKVVAYQLMNPQEFDANGFWIGKQ